jgi:hypothetical protein
MDKGTVVKGYTHIYILFCFKTIYVYIYMCVCVCMCVCVFREQKAGQNHNIKIGNTYLLTYSMEQSPS